jgi:hypothetical protein
LRTFPARCPPVCAFTASFNVADNDLVLTLENFTFLLAFLGYLGLSVNMVLVSRGTCKRPAIALVALVVVAHVYLVWACRYDWQIAMAVRNGYAGFFIFHAALLSIVTAPFVPTVICKPLIVLSFLIVSAGASGAVFRYEVVSIYRMPVLINAGLGIGYLIYNQYRKYKPAR